MSKSKNKQMEIQFGLILKIENRASGKLNVKSAVFVYGTWITRLFATPSSIQAGE